MVNSATPTVFDVQDIDQATLTLRALGVRVELTGEHPAIDFTGYATHNPAVPYISSGRIEVSPQGEYVVYLHELAYQHHASVLAFVGRHFLTRGTDRADWDETVTEDGTTVTPMWTRISIDLATDYLELRTVADQIDRPGACRTCGRKIRAYKPGEGGWVCPKHRVEPTTVNGYATRRLLEMAAAIANERAAAWSAERAGEAALAIRLHEVVAIMSAPKNLHWQVSEALKLHYRAIRKTARQR